MLNYLFSQKLKFLRTCEFSHLTIILTPKSSTLNTYGYAKSLELNWHLPIYKVLGSLGKKRFRVVKLEAYCNYVKKKKNSDSHIYIYIYIERERERESRRCIFIHLLNV